MSLLRWINRWAVGLLRWLGRRAVVDGVVVVVALWGAYLLRFDFNIPSDALESMLIVTPIVFVIQLVALRSFGVHRVMGRYFSYTDLGAFAMAAVVWLVPMIGARFLSPITELRIPLSVSLIDTMLVVGGMVTVRIGQRLEAEFWSVRGRSNSTPKGVILVGAGDAGAKVARELGRGGSELRVIGFVDDDPNKHAAVVAGKPVLGSIDDIPRLAGEHEIDHVIVTIADPTPRILERVVNICATVQLRSRSIPSFLDIVKGIQPITAFRDVVVEDLLGRDPVTFDTDAEVIDFLRDRVVMVTGAGGSIGSELARQTARVGPTHLLLVERFEGALFEINRELERTSPGVPTVPLVADITDEPRMRALFEQYRPDVVVHAAAHKHVRMMEKNPREAVKNNTLGTKRVADLAGEFGASCFVLVSTDKAVRPTSIMGATKRLAEMVVQRCSDSFTETKYVAVRFGNVLGSSGSVIPIFREQISRGGPVTVTDAAATRYFMTIPEASRLVLTAGAIGHGGEIMVLDMGEPVRIIDLARNLIQLSGFVPGHDIDIKFTGLRRGEKLSEELYSVGEQLEVTRHPKILVGLDRDYKSIGAITDELATLVDSASPDQLRRYLGSVVPANELAVSSTASASE